MIVEQLSISESNGSIVVVVNGINTTVYPAVFICHHCKTPESEKSLFVIAHRSFYNLQYIVDYDKLSINGEIKTSAFEAVETLNTFIGKSFKSSAGTVNSGDTITDFTHQVTNDNNVLTIVTDEGEFSVQYPVVHGFIQLPVGTNLDNIKTPGVYQILGDSGYIMNISKTASSVLQTRIGYSDLIFNFFRSYTISTGVWGAWTSGLATQLTSNSSSVASSSSLTYQLDQKILALQTAVTGTLIRFNVTGLNITINNGSVYNLIQHLVGLSPALAVGVVDADFPRVNTGANALLRFPAKAKLTSYMLDVRLTGSMTSSSDRTFTLQLRRSDNSLVKGDTFTKSGGTALISESNNIFSYTNGVNDPYTTGGLKLEINNNSSSNITLTGFELIIDGTIKNY